MATTYVDQITGGGETVAYKAPCRVATTANIGLTGLLTVDGVALAAGDRVLVKNQTDAKQNGIYLASSGEWGRARDLDSRRDVAKGTRVTVTDGSANAGREYVLTTANPVVIGTSNIMFVETLSSDAGGSAAAAEASRIAAEAAAADAEADRVTVAADKDTVADDKATVAADKATAVAAKDTAVAAAVSASDDADQTALDRVQTDLDRVAAAQSAADAAASAGSLTPVEDQIGAATTQATPLDADQGVYRRASDGLLRKFTFTNLKAFLKTYFDTLYQAVGSYVTTARNVSTQHSLTGGGNLSADRTLSLVGDTASPGNNKVYGTDGSGNRGWYDASSGSGAPSGSVMWFAANSPPTGYLKANGAAVSRSTYSALFTAIGTTFGAGDGSTTFNVPELRGEFVRGWDDSRGIDSGRSFGTAQADQMQQITGSISHVWMGRSSAVTAGAISRTNGTSQKASNGSADAADLVSFDSANSPSARTGSETRARNVALLACIKF